MKMVLAVWKYFTTENGEQYVMILGVLMMQQLHVVSLDIDMQLEHFEEERFFLVMGGYGWMVSLVLAVNKISLVALIMNGEILTAIMMTMSELNVFHGVL